MTGRNRACCACWSCRNVPVRPVLPQALCGQTGPQRGAYASVFYRGPYSRLADVCAALWPRLAAQGLRQDGPVMELYHIDAHDTARVDEYLTEVQVRVARAGQKGSGEHGV